MIDFDDGFDLYDAYIEHKNDRMIGVLEDMCLGIWTNTHGDILLLKDIKNINYLNNIRSITNKWVSNTEEFEEYALLKRAMKVIDSFIFELSEIDF